MIVLKKGEKYDKSAIPLGGCVLIHIEETGEDVAVCHDADGEFRFYELTPIAKIGLSAFAGN